MKKVLVILIISSIFLTQCYTLNEYLTKDYSFNDNDKFTKIILSDSTERKLKDIQYQYKVESDSLLIIYYIKSTMQGDYEVPYSGQDTLLLNDITSISVSEINFPLTILTSIFGGVAALYFFIWVSGGPMGGSSLGGGNF